MYPTKTYEHAATALEHLAELIKDPEAGNTNSRQAAQAILSYLMKTREHDLRERQVRLKEVKHKILHPPPDDRVQPTPEQIEWLAADTERIQRELDARRASWKIHTDIWRAKHGAAAPPLCMVVDPFNYQPMPETYLPDPAYHGEEEYIKAAGYINHDPTPPRTLVKRVALPSPEKIAAGTDEDDPRKPKKEKKRGPRPLPPLPKPRFFHPPGTEADFKRR